MKIKEERHIRHGDLVLWKPLMGSSRGRVKTAVVLDVLGQVGSRHDMPGKVLILMDGQRKEAWEDQLRLIVGGGQDDAE